MKILYLSVIGFMMMSFVINPSLAIPTNVFFGSVVNIDKGQNAGGDTSIAAQGNSVYVAWSGVSTPQNGDIFFKKSDDKGNTFGNAINLSHNSGNSYQPQVAVSGNNVYVAWVDESQVNGAGINIFFVKSMDGGKNFGQPVALSKTIAYSSATSNVEPKMIVSGNDIYVGWLVKNFDYVRIMLDASTDDGTTFGGPVAVDNNEGDYQPQTFDFATSGDRVYMVWVEYDAKQNSSPSNRISFAKSTDGGKSFGDIFRFPSSSNANSFAAQVSASGNDVYLTWQDGNEGEKDNQIYFSKSVDGGNNFGKSVATGLVGIFPKIALSGNNVYIASFVIDNETSPFFIKSSDGGQSFNQPSKISNYTWSWIAAQEGLPNLNMQAVGDNVFVTWKQDTVNQTRVPLIATSSDDGNNFNVIDLDKNAHDMWQDFPQMATTETGLYVIWSDVTNNTFHVNMVPASMRISTVNDNSSGSSMLELPFVILILLISITSVIVLKMKFRK